MWNCLLCFSKMWFYIYIYYLPGIHMCIEKFFNMFFFSFSANDCFVSHLSLEYWVWIWEYNMGCHQYTKYHLGAVYLQSSRPTNWWKMLKLYYLCIKLVFAMIQLLHSDFLFKYLTIWEECIESILTSQNSGSGSCNRLLGNM